MAMGGTVARLRAEFLLDLGEYRKGLKTAEQEGEAAATSIRQKMADAFNKTYKMPPAGGTQMVPVALYQRQFAALKAGVQGIGTAMKNIPHAAFNAGLNVAHKTLNGIKGLMGSIGKGFAIGIGFGGAQMLGRALADLANVIPDLITKGKEYGQVVADVTQVTGVSGERASEFVGVLKLMGAPMQNIVQLMAQFQRNLQTPAVKKAFAEIGISIYDMNGNVKDAIVLLNEGRAAIEKLGIGTVTIGNIQRAFGRGGIKVFDDYIRMSAKDMDSLIAKVHDMGLVMSAAQAQAAENMNWTMNQWNLTITGIGVGLFTELAPMINTLLSALSDWVTNNRQKIVDFFGQITASVIGFVAGLFDANLAVQSFADSLDSVVKTQSPALATLMGRQNDVASLEAQVAEEKLKGAGASKAAGAAIDRQTKALDKQSKALTELDAIQEKVYRRALEGITKQLDAELKLMDAEEKRRGLADKDAQLAESLRNAREQLNEAEIALAAAQLGDRGKVDADAVANQMKAVVDAQRDIADAQKAIGDEALDRIDENRRAQIAGVKDYIAGLDKLVEDAMSKASALKTLGGRESALSDALKAAQASGDTVATGDIQAQLDAVRATQKRVNQQIANEKKQDTIAALKEQLAQERSLISSSTQTTAEIRLKAAKLLRDRAAENYAEEVQWAKTKIAYALDFGEVVGGEGDTSLPSRFTAAANAGAAMAQTLKDAFLGAKDGTGGLVGAANKVSDAIGGIGKALDKLIGLNLPDWLIAALGGAAIGTKVGGPIGAAVGFVGGAVASKGSELNEKGNPEGISIGAYNKAIAAYQEYRAQFGLPNRQRFADLLLKAGIASEEIVKIANYWKGKGLIEGFAMGGLAGSRGPQRTLLGEQGAEWVINAPALRALTSLNRSPATALAAVAGGGAGGSPAVIRLEIGGRPLLDYMDEHLVYRRRV